MHYDKNVAASKYTSQQLENYKCTIQTMVDIHKNSSFFLDVCGGVYKQK